jgi:hypothetical protein
MRKLDRLDSLIRRQATGWSYGISQTDGAFTQQFIRNNRLFTVRNVCTHTTVL